MFRETDSESVEKSLPLSVRLLRTNLQNLVHVETSTTDELFFKIEYRRYDMSGITRIIAALYDYLTPFLYSSSTGHKNHEPKCGSDGSIPPILCPSLCDAIKMASKIASMSNRRQKNVKRTARKGNNLPTGETLDNTNVTEVTMENEPCYSKDTDFFEVTSYIFNSDGFNVRLNDSSHCPLQDTLRSCSKIHSWCLHVLLAALCVLTTSTARNLFSSNPVRDILHAVERVLRRTDLFAALFAPSIWSFEQSLFKNSDLSFVMVGPVHPIISNFLQCLTPSVFVRMQRYATMFHTWDNTHFEFSHPDSHDTYEVSLKRVEQIIEDKCVKIAALCGGGQAEYFSELGYLENVCVDEEVSSALSQTSFDFSHLYLCHAPISFRSVTCSEIFSCLLEFMVGLQDSIVSNQMARGDTHAVLYNFMIQYPIRAIMLPASNLALSALLASKYFELQSQPASCVLNESDRSLIIQASRKIMQKWCRCRNIEGSLKETCRGSYLKEKSLNAQYNNTTRKAKKSLVTISDAEIWCSLGCRCCTCDGLQTLAAICASNLESNTMIGDAYEASTTKDLQKEMHAAPAHLNTEDRNMDSAKSYCSLQDMLLYRSKDSKNHISGESLVSQCHNKKSNSMKRCRSKDTSVVYTHLRIAQWAFSSIQKNVCLMLQVAYEVSGSRIGK